MPRLFNLLLPACSSISLSALGFGLETGSSACMSEGTCDASTDETSALQINKGRSVVGHSSKSDSCPVPVKFFDVDKVQDEIPLPPSTYPEELQGLRWMDQSGAYSSSSLSNAAPDYIVSYADPIKEWCPKKRTISVAPWGKTWTWFNTAEGYVFFGAAKFVSYIYNFKFNEDLTKAVIDVEFTLGPFGTWTIPRWLLEAAMIKQTPPKGACPPPPQATKEQNSQCASWRRETTLLPLFGGSKEVYYIFGITDNEGNKIQPYYDAYVQWASQPENNRGDPDAFNTWIGGDLQEFGGMKPGRSFVGTQGRTVPGWNPCNPDSPCQNFFSFSAIAKCLSAVVSDMGAV